MPYYSPPEPSGDEGHRLCARGSWCSARTTTVIDGERVTEAARGPRVWCDKDAGIIGRCLHDFPAIYLRLAAELHHPNQAETHVRSPFGPSIPVRLDVDEVMRLLASTLVAWECRVRSVAPAHLLPRDPEKPVHDAAAVRDASNTLAEHATVLLALQPAWSVVSHPIPPGRSKRAARGATAYCLHCGRPISRTPVGRVWWATDGKQGRPCEHEPAPETITQPSTSPLPAELAAELADAPIVRVGADFISVMGEQDAAAAGLGILHMHYWARAVLRETPARPEELIGVECRACSHRPLCRAEPPWHDGDPEFYTECLSCGDTLTEPDYREWVGLLHAYHQAREADRPTLATPPHLPAGVTGAGGRA